MPNQLTLMCILAHPDDESLGNGGILAKYSAEGVKTYLLTATRGESGWFGEPGEYPGPEALGRIREHELRSAASVLGLQDVSFLDYRDGELDQAEPAEVIARIVTCIRLVRPHVVVTSWRLRATLPGFAIGPRSMHRGPSHPEEARGL